MRLENRKILVVDDEADIRDIISEFLEEEGAEVSEAANGQEAFELAQVQSFDLILSDVRMSTCGGLELLNMVKASDKKMPEFVLMSSFVDMTEEEAQNLGARALFLKPGKIEEVIDLIYNTLL